MRMLPALIPAMLLPGCMVGPNHTGPGAPPRLSLKLRAADLPAITASILRSHWWRPFDGANLDRLAE